MSVQVTDRHPVSVKKLKGAESLTTPKKRKHDTTDRESSKKKKKQKTQDPEETEQTLVKTAKHSKEEKKKSKKSKVDVATGAQLIEGVQETQDIELPDAPALRQEPVEAAGARSTKEVNHDASAFDFDDEEILNLLESEDPSSFYSTQLSLYLSIPAISLEAGASSILATHLAPLLLTYFPPAQGIVLAFSDPVLSAKPNSGINLPFLPPTSGDLPSQQEVYTGTADEHGVSWVWLTVTFLVFRPQKGDALYGWTNVTSEGFIGLVSYNYFQTAIGKTRIPGDWKWSGASREQAQRSRKKGRKGRLRGEDDAESTQENGTQEADTNSVEDQHPQVPLDDEGGYFADVEGAKVQSTLQFRVVDTEVVPAHDRHKWSLQIEGTLLDDGAEKAVLNEDRAKFERAQNRSRSKSPSAYDVVMSGARGTSVSREGSVVSRFSGQTPTGRRSGR